MKKFIFSILSVSVFFIGVGALVEKTGAKFKSDEKALALIARSRVAIGGDAAINNVQSMIITGKTTHNMKFNGVERAETGDTEIALQLPDKMTRSMKMGHGDMNGEGVRSIDNQIDVVVVGDADQKMKVTVNTDGRGEGAGTGAGTSTSSKKIIIKKDDGTVQELSGADSDAWIAANPNVPGEKHVIVRRVDGAGNEISVAPAGKVTIDHGDGDSNTTFKSEDGKTIILRKSEGGNATFTPEGGDHIMLNRVGGEGHHDGMRSNELLRTTLGLLLTAPKGMDISYTLGGDGDVDGTSCDIVVAEFGGTSYKLFLSKTTSLPIMMTYTGMPMPQIMMVLTKTHEAGAVEGSKEPMVFTSKTKAPGGETTEYSVKFSDYRSVGGVQLPYKWTQTVGGSVNETFDVTNYDINPANIGEKFQNQKVMVRMKHPDGQK